MVSAKPMYVGGDESRRTIVCDGSRVPRGESGEMTGLHSGLWSVLDGDTDKFGLSTLRVRNRKSVGGGLRQRSVGIV